MQHDITSHDVTILCIPGLDGRTEPAYDKHPPRQQAYCCTWFRLSDSVHSPSPRGQCCAGHGGQVEKRLQTFSIKHENIWVFLLKSLGTWGIHAIKDASQGINTDFSIIYAPSKEGQSQSQGVGCVIEVPLNSSSNWWIIMYANFEVKKGVWRNEIFWHQNSHIKNPRL